MLPENQPSRFALASRARVTRLSAVGALAVFSCLTLSACSGDAPDPASPASPPPTASVSVAVPAVPSGNTAIDPDADPTGLIIGGAASTANPYVTSDNDVLAGASDELIQTLEEGATSTVSPEDSLDPAVREAAVSFVEIYFGQRSDDKTSGRWIDRLDPTISEGYEKQLRQKGPDGDGSELAYSDPQGRKWRYDVDVDEVIPSDWFKTTATDETVTVTFTSQLIVDEVNNNNASPRTLFVHIEKISGAWVATGIKETGDHEPW